METEMKISIIVALALILTALIDLIYFNELRIAAGLATAYVIFYAVRRMRKRRSSESVVSKG